MHYALIKAGQVTNIIVADEDFIPRIAVDWDAIVPAGDAGIGWKWDGKKLKAPPAPDAPTEPTPAQRHISVGAFYDRFGAAKWGILASADPGVTAVIKDASVRKFIDLDNPALPMGIAIIQAAGFEIDGTTIIDAPVQPGEEA